MPRLSHAIHRRCFLDVIPSSKQTVCYGKWLFIVGDDGNPDDIMVVNGTMWCPRSKSRSVGVSHNSNFTGGFMLDIPNYLMGGLNQLTTGGAPHCKWTGC